MRKPIIISCMLASILMGNAWADESVQYQKKTLPNGDELMTYTSSDGTKVTAIQRKDGSSESTTLGADGTKIVTIQHQDGTVESHMTPGKTE